jgi:hypothetical protein
MSVAIVAVVSLGLWAGYYFHHRAFLGLMMVIVAVIVFFGLLACPGSYQGGTFSEARIRLAITATLLIAYLVYFGTVVFLEKNPDEAAFAPDVLPTLTNLLSITIPFYFGATAALEIAKVRSQGKRDEDTTPNS